MTKASKLKQTIRARTRKTGESYTAARRSYLKPPAPPSPAPRAKARTAGSVSDAKAVENTGHGLDHWFAVLDRFSKGKKDHPGAARNLSQDHDVPMWYCQGITVAWERARGLRAVNQAMTGFQVAVSKMVHADLESVIAAFRPSARRKWLAAADPGLRRALEAALAGKGIVRGPKRSRLRCKWDGTSVELVLEPRATGTSVIASNTKLRDAAPGAERRAHWRTALDALKAQLTR
jgi:hypothetical protein